MNNTTSVQDMTLYLKQVMEMESSVYEQKAAINEAKANLKFKEPRQRKYKEPEKPFVEKPEEPKYQKEYGFMELVIFYFFDILFFVIGFICFSESSILGGFIIGLAILYFVGLYSIQSVPAENAKKRESYTKTLEKYEEDIKKAEEAYSIEVNTYEENVEKAKEQYKKEYAIAQTHYDAACTAISQFNDPLEEAKEILGQLYATDWIFPKYRNMVAICTFYEYFASGRVSSLEGPNGAYNLYESELRQNLIINKMDTIIEQLEDIKQNQYTLYMTLEKTNDILEGISWDIRDILDTTKDISTASNITACCSQAIEKNTEALKYLKLING